MSIDSINIFVIFLVSKIQFMEETLSSNHISLKLMYWTKKDDDKENQWVDKIILEHVLYLTKKSGHSLCNSGLQNI